MSHLKENENGEAGALEESAESAALRVIPGMLRSSGNKF